MYAVILCIAAATPFEDGSAALVRGDWQAAVDAFTAAIAAEPTAKAYINRGIAYVRLGKAREALADYNAAVKIDPQEPAAYTNRGTLLSRAGYPDLAIADYTRALKLKPDAAVYAMRGGVHHGGKRYDKARADYLAALKLNGDEHTALNNLAWLESTCPDAALRDGPAAVKRATRVCELTKWKVKAYASTLAAAHAESGEFETAVAIAERFGDDNLATYRAGNPVRE